MAKQPKKFTESHDPVFGQLVKEVTSAIERHKNTGTQKERFEELRSAEKLFKDTLLTYRISTEMYKKFIQLIRVVHSNILSARPYFRENSKTFSNKITPALKTYNPEALKEFDINYHFIKFCRDKWIGLWPKKLEIIYKRVELARTILIEVNMPICINRAKLFYKKVPKSHLSFNDMVEVSAMGLCAAIDKYSGPFLPNFVGVIIGRSVGNLIDAYSETNIHFYPCDRRVLYRANSIKGRQGITDIVELTKAVNESFIVDIGEGRTAPKQVTASELSSLMHAASILSADSNEGEEGCGVYSYTPDSAENAEEALSKKQDNDRVGTSIRKLPIINQKVLKLKGIDF